MKFALPLAFYLAAGAAAGAAAAPPEPGADAVAFMRFAIDVLYLDRSGRVVKAVSSLKPFRLSGVLRGGDAVIELPSGVIVTTDTAVGDELVFENALSS